MAPYVFVKKKKRDMGLRTPEENTSFNPSHNPRSLDSLAWTGGREEGPSEVKSSQGVTASQSEACPLRGKGLQRGSGWIWMAKYSAPWWGSCCQRMSRP